MEKRVIEYQWQYMEFLRPFKLSCWRTAAFLRLYLFIAKRDTLEKLGRPHKL